VKNFAFALVAVGLLIGTPALAADLAVKASPPPAPVATWTGWYAGLNAGAVWGDDSVSWAAAGGPGLGFNPAGAANINLNSPGHVRTVGFTGGGQAGYNLQVQSFVAGVEADVEYTGIDGTRAFLSTVFANPYAQSVRSDWLGTLRGRLGFAYGPLLFYGTGGLAVAQLKYSDNFLGLHGIGPINSSVDYSPRAGWTAGGGAEWAFAPHWSAKAEYLFVDLGSQTDSASTVAANNGEVAVIGHAHSFTENIARLGVNYRWAQ
jgi:outer membrane immunogenic protein